MASLCEGGFCFDLNLGKLQPLLPACDRKSEAWNSCNIGQVRGSTRTGIANLDSG